MVSFRNGRGIWNVRAMPLWQIRSGVRPPISAPPKVMDPPDGRRAPEMQLNSVVLPEPLGPMSPRISPSRTSIETSWRAVKPPKRLVRRETVSMARGGGRGARPRAPARPVRSAAGGPRRGGRERQDRRGGGHRLGEYHLELPLVHLEHHRERALVLAAHRVALGEELHAVAH